MNTLNISDNIVRLRHKKNITQEQLADFVGVTKASVSKWETKQSLPDILLLPQLAAFFDVTIDELLGYEPQLSKEQIGKIYHDLAAAFAKESFEEAMKKSKEYIKKYYSCYPFIFHIGNLWLNHFMLAESKERQTEVLNDILDLCGHIISGCKDIGICEDAVILKSAACLQLGKLEEVIGTLEDILNPCRLSKQSDAVLIQAYKLAGQQEKADSYTQMSMFLHLISLVASATQYITIHSDKLQVCEETIRQMEKVMAAYDLEHLHPNSTAGFRYQAAVVYCMHGRLPEGLQAIKGYADDVLYMLTDNNLAEHGNSYFTQIQNWYEALDIGADAPRDKKVIFEGFVQSLDHPAFAVLENKEEFQKIKKSLEERGETL